ncbi:atypical chemokine receptor 3-like [Antennarius striatus]|uniref:atypical chemokine receptor 3-like n=1 Tax=Antennarius striatus TaxID=241820 RepID=UPI0035AEE0A4
MGMPSRLLCGAAEGAINHRRDASPRLCCLFSCRQTEDSSGGDGREPAAGAAFNRDSAPEPSVRFDQCDIIIIIISIMSVGADDLTELMELWEELNLTDHYNLSHVETLLCSGAISHASFLRLLSVLYVCIFLVGVAGNILVVWVNLRWNRNFYETHLYVLNLAVADLCVVATLPVWVASLLQGGRWPFGEAACKLTHLVFSVNLFSSIFFLTCMSVDRYLSIAVFTQVCDSRRKKVVRRLICILVWLLALAASIPDTYFLQAVPSSHHSGMVCRPVYPPENIRWWMAGVQLNFITLGFVVPLPVITVSYLLLVAVISPTSDQERRTSRRIICSYIVVFLVCWLPFHTVLMLDTLWLLQLLPFSCQLENFLDVALHMTQGIALLHCCVNPILYNILSRNYRYDLMKAFIFKYSTKTGLTKLIDGSQASDTEVSSVPEDNRDLL